VWVFCETRPDGTLAHVARELLGAATTLAGQLGTGVGGVLIGAGVAGAAREAIACGAGRVYLADDPAYAEFDDVRFARLLGRLIREYAPDILLGGATAIGRALLPRVAVETHTGLTADCTRLEIDPVSKLLQQTRPAFGGNLLATIICEKFRPQMATVRPGVFPAAAPDPARRGQVIRIPGAAALGESALRWLEFRPRPRGDVDLRSAEIVVTAGYGTGGAKGVELAAALARALGGVLGASRAVVDAGWVTYPHQVGQTGTTVQPKLYIACGVSGAIQHIVGMQNSEMIVAINKDPQAPVFRFADVAIVGDLFDVIPEILRQLGV